MTDQPRTAVILLQDVTALKKSERELRKTQKDLESAVETGQKRVCLTATCDSVGSWLLELRLAFSFPS